MEIRYITSTDNKMTISKIYAESWKYAYKGMIPQAYLDSISEEQWVANLGNSDRKTIICIDDGIIVGTSSFSASRLERFAGWGEIISIYLLPDYIGKGYGKRLIEYAVSELKKLGYKDIFLWVLEENIRAKKFYEKVGFIPTHDYLNDHIGGKEVKEIRYIYKGNENKRHGI